MSKADPDKLLIILPAFNEEATIERLLLEIREVLPHADCLVVNDGSTDRTGAVAREAGVQVVDLPFNLGIGGAVQTGYKYALTHGYRIAVQVDADGQHDPAQIPRLLDPLQRRADLVIGSRFLNGESPFRSTLLRRVGITFFSWLLLLLTGQRITDPSSGFRAAGRRAIGLFARNYPVDYPEMESLVLVRKRKLSLREVPVRMRPRRNGSSSITILNYPYILFKVTLGAAITALREVKGEVPCNPSIG